MKPAEPGRDYRPLVRDSYDRIAGAYNRMRTSEADDVLAPLIGLLCEGARVLDLGCGAGVPVTRALATRFDVTGVDISGEQIALAREQVPAAHFLHADMAGCTFPPASFDAVVSFYAIFHLPLEEQPTLLARVAGWLKSGGYLMATLARVHEEGYTEDDFFGTEMYWSNLSLREYRALLMVNGFEILSHADTGHGYSDEAARPESHPLVFARKLRPEADGSPLTSRRASSPS